VRPINHAWVLLKQGGEITFSGGVQPNQPVSGDAQAVNQSQSAPAAPAEQEDAKPIYDQKQNAAIAHFLIDDIGQIAEKLYGQSSGQDQDFDRLIYDIQRIKQILENALTGAGPSPQGGGSVG
jgi:hypothetical protein